MPTARKLPLFNSASLKLRELTLAWPEFRREWGNPLTIAAGLWVLFYLVQNLLLHAGPALERTITDLAFVPLAFLAAFAAWMTCKHTDLDPLSLRAWRFLTAAYLSKGIGDAACAFYDVVLHRRAFPSLSNIPLLAFIPLLLFGLLSFPRPEGTRRDDSRFWLDAATVTLGGGMAYWYFVLRPTFLVQQVSLLEASLSVAYIAGDVLLLFGGATVWLGRRKSENCRQLSILIAGLFLFMLADLGRGYMILNKTYQTGSWPDSLWMIANFLMVASCGSQLAKNSRKPKSQGHAFKPGRSFSLLPYLGIAVGYGLLVRAAMRGWSEPLGGLIAGSVLLTALVVARQVIAIRENERARAELRESETQYRLLFHNNPAPMWVQDSRTLDFLAVNDAAIAHYGYSREEFLCMNVRDIRPPEDVKKLEDFFKQSVPTFSKSGEWRHQKKDGSIIDVEITSHVTTFRGRDARLVLANDMTERKFAGEALALAEAKYRSIFENAVEGIFQSTPDGRFVSANPALAAMLGYHSPQELIDTRANTEGQNYVSSESHRELKRLLEDLKVVRGFEVLVYRKDRSKIWISENISSVYDDNGDLLYYEGIVADITDRKRAEQKLLHDAFHDGLTGLPNRALLVDHLQLAVERTKTSKDYMFAVMFLDLDRFKLINDSLGHAVGDKLLVGVARRLENCLREVDTVARLGGDEFAILIDGMEDLSDATRVADRIQRDVMAPFSLCDQKIVTTVSIGITLSTTGYENADELLRDADTAMYRAKLHGKACHEIFDKVMHANAVKALQLETDLRRALERGEFRVYYQPIVSLETGIIRGFEALIRWLHPERGIMNPGDFIPIAEETGLIVRIGEWVLREACRQVREWQLKNPENKSLRLSVNLSGKQFTQSNLVKCIKDIVTEEDFDPRMLSLEITESTVIHNTDAASTMLQELREFGVELSMDDFGTGYSSLSYLHRFAVQTLKIDRSFISSEGSGDENQIVRTIITLARDLGMDVVAEGIETEWQLEQLKSLDCALGQGYLFSRPVSAESAGNLINSETFAMAEAMT